MKLPKLLSRLCQFRRKRARPSKRNVLPSNTDLIDYTRRPTRTHQSSKVLSKMVDPSLLPRSAPQHQNGPQLPPEVLSIIFTYLHYSFAFTYGTDVSMFAVMRVCRSWRISAYEVFFDENSQSWSETEWKAKASTIAQVLAIRNMRELYADNSQKIFRGRMSRKDIWQISFRRGEHAAKGQQRSSKTK